MDHVLHQQVDTSCIGFAALPALCFESIFAIACEEELKDLTRFLQALIVPSDS